MEVQRSNIVVSISCLTYNHVKYIRQCLDGFLMQQCNFKYEVLIHDDASTDGTIEIIKEYQEMYPDIIKPIIQTENQYSKGIRGMNIKYNFPRAKGKYIALCEGDDFWTDSLKLQKQVDFLEANLAYGLVFTNATIYNQNLEKNVFTTNHSFNTFEDYLLGGGAITCTAMFVKKKLEEFEVEIENTLSESLMGDLKLWLWISSKSKIKVLTDITAIYRISDGTASNHNSFEKRIKFLESILHVKLFFAKKFNFNHLTAQIERNHWITYRNTSVQFRKKCHFMTSVNKLQDLNYKKTVLDKIFPFLMNIKYGYKIFRFIYFKLN